MRKVSLSWVENPCGNRPDYYEVLIGSRVIGKTTGTAFYHENYEDREVLDYKVRGVNQYGKGEPAEVNVDEVIVDFSGENWSYQFGDQIVHGVFLSTGPSSLTASIVP